MRNEGAMTPEDMELMARLVAKAEQDHDGHLTIMRFTTNWRVSFGTPFGLDPFFFRAETSEMAVGDTFAAAANKALADPKNVFSRLAGVEFKRRRRAQNRREAKR